MYLVCSFPLVTLEEKDAFKTDEINRFIFPPSFLSQTFNATNYQCWGTIDSTDNFTIHKLFNDNKIIAQFKVNGY